jgi:hypothetical protein
MVEDQQSPAFIVPADLRAGFVHSAAGLFTPGQVPEKGAGMRQFCKDALVIEEGMLVRIDDNRALFPGIIIADQKTVLPVLFPDRMDIPEVAAAFPAPEAFKGQAVSPP